MYVCYANHLSSSNFDNAVIKRKNKKFRSKVCFVIAVAAEEMNAEDVFRKISSKDEEEMGGRGQRGWQRGREVSRLA